MTTITIPRAVVEQALEALYEETAWFGPTPKGAAAITALRAALAQEQAEPPYAGKAARLNNDHIQIDPVTGNVSIGAEQAEPVQEPDSPERRCGGPGCDGTCCQPVQEPVNDILRMAREAGFLPNANPVMPQLLARFAALVRADERERIKAANAPEIERINAHIKALEEAVADEREACARACEEYTDNGGGNVEDHEGHGHHLAAILRARSKA